MRPASSLLAGVELGGTKCVCILGCGPDDIRAQVSIATRGPQETLAQINAVLDQWSSTFGTPDAVGIASFGPLDLRPSSSTFGQVTSDAKRGWRGTDVLQALALRRGIPFGFNTDVNAAALAEGRWGAARSLTDFAYITVGTGVGVGLVVQGRPVFGCNHSELGHLRIARAAGDQWAGHCAFHGACIEGLASGPAIEARAGVPSHAIPADSPVWEPVAHALGELLHALLLATAPQRILLGGGVMEKRPELIVRARSKLRDTLAGYLDVDDVTGGLDLYVVAPALGSLAGPLGALALAADAREVRRA